MATITMTDAQFRRAMKGAATEALRQLLRLQGVKVVCEASLMTSREAMDTLGVSARTLGRLAELGEIERVKVGGVWRYNEASVIEYRQINKSNG